MVFCKTGANEWVVSTTEELHRVLISLVKANRSPNDAEIIIRHTRGKGINAILEADQVGEEDGS